MLEVRAAVRSSGLPSPALRSPSEGEPVLQRQGDPAPESERVDELAGTRAMESAMRGDSTGGLVRDGGVDGGRSRDWERIDAPRDPGAAAPAHWTAAEVEALICAMDWPCAEALAVVYGPTPPNREAPYGCPNGESGGNPRAVGGTSRGLFQINGSAHAARVGGDLDALFDPATNVRVAYAIWLDQGWRPWSCRP